MRIAVPVNLLGDEKKQLEMWSRGRSTPQRLVLRSKIILLAASGLENKQIARELNTRQNTVCLWRNRFISHRISGISKDAPRPGRNPRLTQEMIDAIIDRTLHTKPRGATHWTTRMLAKEMGVSNFTVHQVRKKESQNTAP